MLPAVYISLQPFVSHGDGRKKKWKSDAILELASHLLGHDHMTKVTTVTGASPLSATLPHPFPYTSYQL